MAAPAVDVVINPKKSLRTVEFSVLLGEVSRAFEVIAQKMRSGDIGGPWRLRADAVVLLLRVYKWLVSPWLPPSCRYVPTCSEYAMEAVERYGAVRGSWMAMMRVLRCHPFVKGGYDPVQAAEQSTDVAKQVGI